MWSWIIPLSPFALAGMMFLILPWTNLTTIECRRIQPTLGTCVVHQSALDWQPQRLPLPTFQGVLALSKFRGRSTTSYLVMNTPQGVFQSKNFWSGPEVGRAATQLNQFLANQNQPQVKVVIDQRGQGLVWGAVFLSGIPLVIWVRAWSEPDPFRRR